MVQRLRASRDEERGIALISVMLLLMLVTALATALAVSGQTETLIARNEQSAAQAEAAAEAGLNYGVQVTINKLALWQADGFADSTLAASALLRGPDGASGNAGTDADNFSIEQLFGTPAPAAPIAHDVLAGVPNARFIVRLADDTGGVGEDGQALVDVNDKVVVRSTGYGQGNTEVTLEAVLGLMSLPAVVTNGDLTISGNPVITGSSGGVHSNSNLDISGNPDIAQDATGSGTYSESGHPDVGGVTGGGTPVITVPPVRAIDHYTQADFVLTSDGHVKDRATDAVLCDASADNNACSGAYSWVYNGNVASPEWRISGNTAVNGTFYVQGKAHISGSPGNGGAADPAITIIAEGDIEISGNPEFRPDTPELLFVTNGDLKISGTSETSLAFEGQMLVHEQVMLSGNPTLSGQLLVEDAVNLSHLVDTNTISGDATISYNGTIGGNAYHVAAWREVR